MTPEEQAVIDAARKFIATPAGVAHAQAENVLWAAVERLNVRFRPPLSETPTPIVGHLPHRGSDVETWIKRYRDNQQSWSDEWAVLDDLLDTYREHADAGTPLGEDL